jgi:ABC-2 type transporter/ABC transporter
MDTLNHHTRELSGGQQKRLSIALELVDDPLVLFLDEPTTGLDSSSSTQCIQLLKKLALEGKTIICTIHTPSALLFEMFDHIYALAEGNCIYQGSVKNLVPFLSELDLICPEIYSPSDFLLEIATNDYGEQNHRLKQKIKNGSCRDYRKNPQISTEEDLNFPHPNDDKPPEYSTSFFQQFSNLLLRNFLTNSRDKTLTLMRLLINISAGLCFGSIYFGIGNEASFMFDIQKFVVYSIYHSMFLGFNSQLTTCKFYHHLNI